MLACGFRARQLPLVNPCWAVLDGFFGSPNQDFGAHCVKSVGENPHRPSGTRATFPLGPGTSVPGFHMPPLRGLSRLILRRHSKQGSVRARRSKKLPTSTVNQNIRGSLRVFAGEGAPAPHFVRRLPKRAMRKCFPGCAKVFSSSLLTFHWLWIPSFGGLANSS